MRRNFLRDDEGTDLVEYTLILAFICLVSAAFLLGVGQSVTTIWSVTNSRLSTASN